MVFGEPLQITAPELPTIGVTVAVGVAMTVAVGVGMMMTALLLLPQPASPTTIAATSIPIQSRATRNPVVVFLVKKRRSLNLIWPINGNVYNLD